MGHQVVFAIHADQLGSLASENFSVLHVERGMMDVRDRSHTLFENNSAQSPTNQMDGVVVSGYYDSHKRTLFMLNNHHLDESLPFVPTDNPPIGSPVSEVWKNIKDKIEANQASRVGAPSPKGMIHVFGLRTNFMYELRHTKIAQLLDVPDEHPTNTPDGLTYIGHVHSDETMVIMAERGTFSSLRIPCEEVC